jgi:NAD(P)-dependent dehydrogenase (short-subunit alcohol dehydrogenase family)
VKLQDKVALVTAAGSGFGRATSLLFAQEGAKVIVTDINDDWGEETVNSIRREGREASFIHNDVSKASDVEKAIKMAVEKYGKIDILFNNAGIGQKPGAIEDIPEDEWDKVMSIDLKGIFLMAKYTVPYMKKEGKGSIICTASISGVRPRPMTSVYSAVKAGVVMFSRALAIELANFNIRVNSLCPVYAETHFTDRMSETTESASAMKNAIIAGIPLGRLATPNDIAKAALFYASEDSSFITGTDLYIDGGRAI